MSKRLQVLLDDSEWRELRRAAQANHTTVAEWVRQALRAARRRQPAVDADRKAAAIRAAARHAFPAGEVDQINAETERGYLDDGA